MAEMDRRRPLPCDDAAVVKLDGQLPLTRSPAAL